MSKWDEIRANIIATQAAREAAAPPRPTKKRRTNWAASEPVPPRTKPRNTAK